MGLSPGRRLLAVTICSSIWIYYMFHDLPEATRAKLVANLRAGLTGFVADPVNTTSELYTRIGGLPGAKYVAPMAALAVLSKLLANFFRRRLQRDEAELDAASAAAVAKLAARKGELAKTAKHKAKGSKAS